MALASATALSWRPLPLLRPSFSRSHSVAVKDVAALSVLHSSSPPSRTRQTSRCWSNNSVSSGCSSRSFSNFVLRNSFSSPFLDVRRLKYFTSSKSSERRKMKNDRGVVVTTRAGLKFDSGGGGGGNDNEGGIGRLIVNVALTGGMAYLAVTGKLGWVFDTLVSLWLLAVLIPIVSFVAFLWFAEREIVKGACPNCGQTFQVFEFALKEQPNLCPYCSQPYKLDSERQFVRDEPRFSNERSGGFRDPFGGFGRGSSSPKNEGNFVELSS